MKTLKFLGILLIGLLLLASPANATGYRMIMMAGGVEAADGGNDAYTKLLMHMEGTDDAQVFTDSSVGNLVEVDAGTGFSDAFGVFDGTGDYLSLADHADWDLVADTTDYTVEFWVKHTDHAGTETYISQFEDADNNWQIYHVSGTGIYFNVQSGASSVIQINSGDEIADNEWHHIALNKNSTVYKLYLDGVEIGTTTDASTDTFAGSLYIGSADASTNPFDGSIDEVRILDGVAQYDSAFTPATSNFTSDANTALLLHMDLPNADPESFVDSGNQGHTVTQAGNAYQKARNLGIIDTSAGYFDGTGDYLSVADSADWSFGSGEFTIEGWVRLNSLPTNAKALVNQFDYAGGPGAQWATSSFQLRAHDSGVFDIRVSNGSAGVSATGVTQILVGVWYHVAVVRDSNTLRLFVDGVEEDTGDLTGVTLPDSPEPLLIGSSDGSAIVDLDGYIEDLRIVKGSAVYTANFNPPTTALTAITNTKLLLHFDNGEGSVSFDDDSASDHTVTANGNAIQVIGHGADAVADVKTENTAYKFGSTSAYFDGTGDYVQITESNDFDFSGDFTVDCWIRFNAVATTQTVYSRYTSDTNYQIFIFQDDNNLRWRDYVSGGDDIDVVRSWTPIANTWYHIAVVKAGNDYSLYVDGTKLSTAVTDSNTIPSRDGKTLEVGLFLHTGAPYPFAGYIDELRISKGIARWTANFTPPTAAYYE